MAHESHAEDTGWIVAEQDYRFKKAHATVHHEFLSEQEQISSHWSRWDEIGDAIEDPEERKQFYEDLDKYLAELKQDKNAVWPQRPPDPN